MHSLSRSISFRAELLGQRLLQMLYCEIFPQYSSAYIYDGIVDTCISGLFHDSKTYQPLSVCAVNPVPDLSHQTGKTGQDHISEWQR